MALVNPVDDTLTAPEHSSDWRSTDEGFHCLVSLERFFVGVGVSDQENEEARQTWVYTDFECPVVLRDQHDVCRTLADGTVDVVSDGVDFSELIKKWHSERGATSSVAEMTSCPSYLRIIGMGLGALPLMFARMRFERDDPDHWFVALEAITGVDPIPEDAYGDTVSMAEAWLSWANARGF